MGARLWRGVWVRVCGGESSVKGWEFGCRAFVAGSSHGFCGERNSRPFQVLRVSDVLAPCQMLLAPLGVTAYVKTSHCSPPQGLSQVHVPAAHTPFNEQSVFVVHACEAATREHNLKRKRAIYLFVSDRWGSAAGPGPGANAGIVGRAPLPTPRNE